MSPAPQEQSPLARFVLFMICLGLVASLIAGVWVYAVELPARAHAQPPVNYAATCGPHYDDSGRLIGYQCCDANGRPVSCSYWLDF